MIVLRYAASAAVAVFLVFAVLVDAADARGGGGHGFHAGLLGSHALRPLAATTGGGQKTGSQTPPKTQVDVTSVTTAPVVADTPAPASAVAGPAAQLAPVAPLSPPPTTTILGGGGPARPDALTSAATGSLSPSEAAPSTAGGGGDTLADCMGFWERETHMSKQEWHAACLRVQNRFAGTKP